MSKEINGIFEVAEDLLEIASDLKDSALRSMLIQLGHKLSKDARAIRKETPAPEQPLRVYTCNVLDDKVKSGSMMKEAPCAKDAYQYFISKTSGSDLVTFTDFMRVE